jgi:hypothetical protein
MSEPLFDCMWRIKQSLTKEGKEIAILNLAYGSSFFCCYSLPIPSLLSTIHQRLIRLEADRLPDLLLVARYPRQLQQAAMILDHLITILKKELSKIILMGDSAGANLVMALQPPR